jgi:hypothetical protein
MSHTTIFSGEMGGYLPNSTGPWHFGGIPTFYTSRMAAKSPPDGWSFADSAVSLGAGVRVWIGPKVFLRPDMGARVVMSNGDNYTIRLHTEYWLRLLKDPMPSPAPDIGAREGLLIEEE